MKQNLPVAVPKPSKPITKSLKSYKAIQLVLLPITIWRFLVQYFAELFFDQETTVEVLESKIDSTFHSQEYMMAFKVIKTLSERNKNELS